MQAMSSNEHRVPTRKAESMGALSKHCLRFC